MGACDLLPGCDLSEVPPERLEAELQELAAHIDAGLARWVLLLGEYDARGGYLDWECRSAAQWAQWRCGVAPPTAYEHVRVARAMRELPAMTNAFGAGQLSYSKVRALTRVATPESEGELIGLAQVATAAQLDSIVRASRKAVVRAEQDDAERVGVDGEPDVYLRHRWDDDGCLIGEFRMLPEDGALFLAAIEEHAERRWRHQARRRSAGAGPGDSSAEESSPGRLGAGQANSPAGESDELQPWPSNGGEEWRDDGDGFCSRPFEWPTRGKVACEALLAMAETMLASGPTPLIGGERHQVVVTLDSSVLFRSPGAEAVDTDGLPHAIGERCAIERGPAITSDVARMLACDCSFVVMSMKGAVPESVGAKVRTVSAAMRRKLRLRDQGCRWPGCTQDRFVDAHHVVFWSDGGSTVLSNLVLLCRHHHRAVHVRGCSIEPVGDGQFVFRLADGTEVVDESPIRAPVAGGHDTLVTANDHLGLDIDADTAVAGWTGESLSASLPDAVTAVLCEVKGAPWVMGHYDTVTDTHSS